MTNSDDDFEASPKRSIASHSSAKRFRTEEDDPLTLQQFLAQNGRLESVKRLLQNLLRRKLKADPNHPMFGDLKDPNEQGISEEEREARRFRAPFKSEGRSNSVPFLTVCWFHSFFSILGAIWWTSTPLSLKSLESLLLGT